MDPEVVIIGDDGTEHVFPAGFDPQKAAAIVRGGAPAGSGSQTPVTPMVAAGLGAATKLTPAIVSGVNNVAGPAAKLVSAKGMTPAIAAFDAASSIARGDTKRAATSAGIGVATAAAPKIAKAAQKATNPSVVATRGALGRFMTGGKAAGPVARGAGVLSRIAGAATLPALLLSSLYDTYQGGQAQAAKLDDPDLSQAERDELLRQLHSMGGF